MQNVFVMDKKWEACVQFVYLALEEADLTIFDRLKILREVWSW